MLRILVVLPLYGGSLSVGRYSVMGLREAGCLVDVFEAPSFHSAFEALKELRISSERLDSLQNSFLQNISQAVLAKVESFEPDLVLCLAQAPMSRMALKRLRKEGIPTAMWFVENFRLFTYWRAFAPYYDLFAVIQKEPFVQELSRIGVNNVLYLPLAAEPSVHRPLDLSPEEQKEFGAEVSFMGAGYPNRRRAFSQMVRQDPELAGAMKIWGTEWEEESSLIPLVQRGGARVSTEDCVRIYNATEININLHASVRDDCFVSGEDFVNPRTFEVAACGAFQLADERSLMAELFKPGELATFSNLESLQEQIRHFRKHPEERKAMAARSRERVIAEHSYTARMRSLLQFAEERLPGLGKRKPVAWPEHMPENMRSSVEELMRELDLPPGAGFDDIICAVRSKSEKLSDVEAALLFLDEWKKLYTKE